MNEQEIQEQLRRQAAFEQEQKTAGIGGLAVILTVIIAGIIAPPALVLLIPAIFFFAWIQGK